MITILGAGGVIANDVVKLLSARRQPFRLVARHARAVSAGAEVISADLSDKDQTIRAVAGSSIVHLLAGLKYDHNFWAEMWPRIMANTIEACKRAHAKLIFFDNVYMYGKASGAMTEETPFNPCSKKGEVRAKIATSLINECKGCPNRNDRARSRLLRTGNTQRFAERPGVRATRKKSESFVAC